MENLIGTKRQLLKAGIVEEEFPSDRMIASIIAAHTKCSLLLEDGLKDFSRLFCFDLKAAESNKEYFVVNNITKKITDVENTDVWFFEGAIVRGVPMVISNPQREGAIPPLELEISESTKNQCDGCGILTHCLREITDPYTRRPSSLCNHCITSHEHPKVNDEGCSKRCEECSVYSCPHHFNKIDAMTHQA